MLPAGFIANSYSGEKLHSNSAAEELQKSVPEELQRLHKAGGQHSVATQLGLLGIQLCIACNAEVLGTGQPCAKLPLSCNTTTIVMKGSRTDLQTQI